MTIIKKKSFIVALISSAVISLVLVVNLAGYLIYLELKSDELSKAYRLSLRKLNARVYSRHIEVARLQAGFERTGPLRGQALLEGIVRNDGYRDVTDLIIKVKFMDKDGAVLYETSFHPQEPSLGSPSDLAQVSISHLTDFVSSSMKPESSMAFKKILTNCPKEILSELKDSSSGPGGKGRWSGKLDYEILSVTF